MRGISVAAIRALPDAELLGLQCGPYRLLEIIARGGMGTVYIGESIGDEVSQRVAVKLLRSSDVVRPVATAAADPAPCVASADDRAARNSRIERHSILAASP